MAICELHINENESGITLNEKYNPNTGRFEKEIPQYTLVGNAVPPLMARAIANVILAQIQ